MKTLKTSVFAVSFVLVSAMAQAATWTVNDTACSNSDITPEASACFGFVDGNLYGSDSPDVNSDEFGTVEGLFGYTDWSFIQGDEDFEGEAWGSFEVASNSYSMTAILLKGSDEWAAYRIDSGFSGLLEFTMGNGHGLSNYQVIGRTSEVPLPAAGLLLLGGLAGLGLVRRFQSA